MVAHLVKKLSVFMQTGVSLLYSENPQC